MKIKAVLLDEIQVKRAMTRISYEIIEKSNDLSNVVLLGVRTRGIPLAQTIQDNIARCQDDVRVPVGKIDISFYRDDISHISETPALNGTDIPVSVDKKDVIIVDDVIFTGRTARAAMDAVFALGRPKSIRLAVLVDRGHRELPIKAEFVGKNIPTSMKEVIKVNVPSIDGKSEVELYELD